MTRLRVVLAVFVVSALVVGACGASDDDGSAPTSRPAVELDRIASTAREDGPSALDEPEHDGLPRPTVDVARLRSGGPGPDGIPAVDEPRFERANQIDWLDDREPVLALEIDGEARAYPVQILVWHEIVNDAVGGVPVTVSYCPLCNSALAFDRRLGDRVLDFGVSGLLLDSDLVMFDRQTESLWPQLAGEAVAGALTGEQLRPFPVQTVSFGDWRKAHPRGWVLSRDTGANRNYGQNPYPGYDDIDSTPFLFDGELDGRLAAKAHVVGIADDDAAVAVSLARLRDERVVNVELSGRPVVVWWQPGTSSALDDAEVANGRDVGTTGVFDPTVDGQELQFRAVRGGFRDEETSTIWNVLGEAQSGPLAGTALTPIAHADSFWFAWAAFSPDTTIASSS